MKFTGLQLQLAAESKTFWKWNPFKPALAHNKADDAAMAVREFQVFKNRYLSGIETGTADGYAFMEGMAGIAGRLESAYGKRRPATHAPSIKEYRSLSHLRQEIDHERLTSLSDSLGDAISELQTVRRLS